MKSPLPIDQPTQCEYEVRLDWGREGLYSIGPGAGVIILVDAFSFPTVKRAPAGPAAPSPNGSRVAALAALAAGFGVPVVGACLRNRTAVARWVLSYQHELGARAKVAIVAAGKAREHESVRFAVEDQLTAGAVVDALAVLGIDASSPEAATACAAWLGLRRAAGHLFTASVTGRRLIEAGQRADVESAAEVDVSDAVPLLDPGRGSAAFVIAGIHEK